MQDYPLRSDRLRSDWIFGAVFATFAAIFNWYLGFILMMPVAILLTWATAIPFTLSLLIAAGGLAGILTIAVCLLLWAVARSDPEVAYVAQVCACSWAVGCFVGEAFAWLLLQQCILSPS